MRSEGSITHWIHEIKDGNRGAAQGLWERYFARIVGIARKELAGSDRRVADEEDVAQNVFDAFCRAAENGRFPDLADRDSLWRLLVKMTARKSIDQQRKLGRKRRGGGCIRGESVFDRPGDQLSIAQVIGDDPTPEFVVMMSEQVNWLLELLHRDELRTLAIAKMQGYTNKEIAQQQACSERTVERRLRLIRVQCQEAFPDE